MKSMPSWIYALGALIFVLLFNAFATPGFFEINVLDGRLFGSVIDILNRVAPVALLSLGMTLVIATRGVDLSVGAVMAMSGAVAASLIARPEGNILLGLNFGDSVFLIVLAGLVTGLLCGLFNGLLVSRARIQPIVATLLLMVAGRGVAQLISDGQIITFSAPAFASIARGATLGMPNPFWIVVLFAAVILVLTRWTALGLFIESLGSNPIAARNVGINTGALLLFVYSVTGVCAGMAGMIAAADIQGADANNAGLYLELDAILAVSVGGTLLSGGRFSLVGTLIGAILMQTLTTTILTRGVAPELTLVVKALVVLAVCLLQSPTFLHMLRPKKVAA
ncbi:MAG: ABC transporter permease [Fimbriimonadaceae bacterium]|nr:ABC transporter permease [Fimbriimonadaceae bacterium]